MNGWMKTTKKWNETYRKLEGSQNVTNTKLPTLVSAIQNPEYQNSSTRESPKNPSKDRPSNEKQTSDDCAQSDQE